MVWNSYPANQLNSREIMGKIRALADQPGTRTLSNDGDVKAAFAKADHVIERYFETPFLTHLPMAPMNAVANVHDGKIEVWAGLATPPAPFADLILEMSLIEHPDDLVIHQPYVGGQFGRTNDWDHVLYAVYGSQQAGAPVKVIYDRVTDTRVTPYWPAGGIKIKVGVDKAGMPVAWQINMVSTELANQPKFAVFLAAFDRTPSGIPYDPFPFRTIVDSFAYPAPAFQVQHRDPDVKVPAGFLRGVGATPNTFAVERMIDELAKHAGIDALAYRKSLIKDARLMAVLDAAAARANWGKKLPAGSAQGISRRHLRHDKVRLHRGGQRHTRRKDHRQPSHRGHGSRHRRRSRLRPRSGRGRSDLRPEQSCCTAESTSWVAARPRRTSTPPISCASTRCRRSTSR